MVAIDRKEFLSEQPTDVQSAIVRYILVRKLALERKTLAELKGKA